MGQGAACNCNYTAKRKNTHRPTNPQPGHEPPHAQPRPVPHYSTCHTVASSPVEVKCTNPWNKGKKNPGKEGETLNQESRGREGNQEKRYATGALRYWSATPHHATLTKLWVQRKQNVGTWPAHVPMQHTAGQESAPMLMNNGKCYKRKHSYATNGQHTTKEHQKYSRP